MAYVTFSAKVVVPIIFLVFVIKHCTGVNDISDQGEKTLDDLHRLMKSRFRVLEQSHQDASDNFADLHQELEAMNQRLNEMGVQMHMKVEEMGTQMNIKLEEIQERMTTMEGQLTEIQGSSKQEIMNILQMESELLKTSLNQTSTTSQVTALKDTFSADIQRLEQSIQKCPSREQFSDFQDLFADECEEGSHNCSQHAYCENTVLQFTCKCLHGYSGDGFTCEEVDECTEEVHRCHSKANCTNTAGSYTCSCISGYSGDGFNCEEVDECTEGVHRCHSKANCTNTAGSYTCSCIPGYPGDGFNCEAPPCDSPSKLIEGLGCVIPVKTQMSWQDAEKNCLELDARFLEGITTQNQLDQMKKHFSSFFDSWVWVGIYRMTWRQGGGPILPASLMKENDLASGHECGIIHLKQPTAYLGDFVCSGMKQSLCQQLQ